MRPRLLAAALVALVPVNAVRLLLYRRLFGYRIAPGARIGPLTLLACRSVTLGPRASIGRLNVFKGDFALDAGADLFVGDFNVFISPWNLRGKRRGYVGELSFGDACLVNDGHYLDVHGTIRIGDGSWLAGRASQFYTHGVSVTDRDITIGAGCFVGSAVRFAPGSGVGDRNIVGLGSVVLGRIVAEESLISGFPAAVVRSIAGDLASGRFAFSRDDWGG